MERINLKLNNLFNTKVSKFDYQENVHEQLFGLIFRKKNNESNTIVIGLKNIHARY